MKMTKLLFLMIIGVSLSFAQEGDDEVVTDGMEFGIDITVEKEEPRVSITSSRVRPLFPELPIKKSFVNEILDKYNNNNYVILKRKRVYIANIEKELNKLN